MGLLRRQVERKTEIVTREILREGRVPSAIEIALKIGEFVRDAAGLPTMRPALQTRAAIWDHRATNRVLQDIAFDLGIAYEEALDLMRILVHRYSRVELSYQAQKHQIKELINLLRNLLFVSKNAEDNFHGVYDTFDDLSKINTILTTKGAVDLNEGACLLPQNDVTADRVDLRHLYSRMSWPVLASVPEFTGEEAPDDHGRIVSNEPATNGYFGLAFSDMINSWKQVVVTKNAAGAVIQFVVPVSAQDSDGKTISQIAIIPDMSRDAKVRLLHSLDNANYTRFPNIQEEIVMESGKMLRVDFEQTRCRFVRFEIRLDAPTFVEGSNHTYIFGFRNIAFYKAGRAHQAEIISRPLSAPSMTKAIDAVSISVTDEMPAGCSAQYFVAADDGSGNPRGGIWRPITPITRAPLEGIPQIVKFGESAVKKIYLTPPNPAVIDRTVREVPYYRLTETALEQEPLFGQAFLYRGENAWWRNTQREIVTKIVRDNFVDFNSGDVQRLYVPSTEVADVGVTSDSAGLAQRTVLSVANEIDYDPATMLITPPPDVDPAVDQRPRYAIYQVLMFRDKMTIPNETIVLTGSAWSQLANSGIVSVGSGRPVVKNNAESVTYIEGLDYILETSGDKLTGRIRRIQSPSLTSNIPSGATVKVTYDLDPDITHLVDTVDGRDIILSKNMNGPSDQYFQVTYRYVPRPPLNEIKKSTVKVSEKYGGNEGKVYLEGRDYLIDSRTGTITRIPGGEIQTNGVVFVDFRYEQQPKDLDTFSAWFYVERREPFTIEINPFTIDLEAGERIVIDGQDVSRRTILGEFSTGWHNVVVRSKRPEAFNEAAIRQVAALRDRSGEPVFMAGSLFFSSMTANRIPSTQRSVTQLTKNTPTASHEYFAVTPDGHVIVNFEPGTTEEIYTYGIRHDGSQFVTGNWPEEFRLEYTHALSTADPVRKILYRILLTRSRDAGDGLTPRCYEIHARLA